MSDIVNPTTPVTVYCGENPAESAAITKTVDGAKNRMDVSSMPAMETPYGSGLPIHAYGYDADADVGDVIVTYTVTASKILYVYQWGTSTDSTGWFDLEIDGVTKDRTINESTAGGMRGYNSVNYYPVPLKATAGQVVRIKKVGGLDNKKAQGTIIGIEVAA